MEYNGNGIWIPIEVLHNKNLTSSEKILFAEIYYLDRPDTHCTANNKYLAEFMGMSEANVKKCIAKLKELGFIYTASFDGRKRSLATSVRWTNQIDDSEDTIVTSRKISEYQAERYKNEFLLYRENNIDNNREMKEPEVPTHSKMERYKNREILSDDLHSAEEMEEKSIKKRTGKKYNQDEVEEEILNYTDNVELQDALRDYVATIRHPSMGKYRLKGAPQFRSYLKQLSACIKNVDDVKEILEIVRYSTLHSYPQFYPLSDRNKGNYDRRDPNIVVTPAMTREEKEAEIARRKKRWEERHGEQTSV